MTSSKVTSIVNLWRRQISSDQHSKANLISSWSSFFQTGSACKTITSNSIRMSRSACIWSEWSWVWSMHHTRSSFVLLSAKFNNGRFSWSSYKRRRILPLKMRITWWQRRPRLNSTKSRCTAWALIQRLASLLAMHCRTRRVTLSNSLLRCSQLSNSNSSRSELQSTVKRLWSQHWDKAKRLWHLMSSWPFLTSKFRKGWTQNRMQISLVAVKARLKHSNSYHHLWWLNFGVVTGKQEKVRSIS